LDAADPLADPLGRLDAFDGGPLNDDPFSNDLPGESGGVRQGPGRHEALIDVHRGEEPCIGGTGDTDAQAEVAAIVLDL
ncbi:hypothetical protein ABTJ52_23135, partial [Acinetobacter baumannii]